MTSGFTSGFTAHSLLSCEWLAGVPGSGLFVELLGFLVGGLFFYCADLPGLWKAKVCLPLVLHKVLSFSVLTTSKQMWFPVLPVHK